MNKGARIHLTEARKYRGWSQQEVADALGTTQHNVSRWERGATTPTAYFRAKLCALFDKTPHELGLVEQAPPSPGASTIANAEPTPTSAPSAGEAPTLWAAPYPRNPFFLGRDEELAQIRHRLQTGQAMALSQPQAISGLGGIGKTQLALEYTYRYGQDYQAVLWARAESAEVLMASYVAFATVLALPQREEQEQAVIVEAVKRWLGTYHDWLLILDNADELSILPDFLPSPLAGHLLITTRAAATGRLAHRLEIEILSPERGALLLLRRSGLLAPGAKLSQASPEEQALALQISEELGRLPLALDQAGAYLEETGIALAAYWALYQQHRAELLAQRRGGFVVDHPLPVAATWSLSFERVQEKNPAVAHLLRMAAFLSPDAIPEELFTQGASVLDPILAPVAADLLSFNQALEALRAYSLIRRHPASQTLSVHRLVQAVLQDTLEQAVQRDWAEQAVLTVNAVFPRVEYAMWPQCERLLAQALVAIQWIERYQLVREEAARLLFETASYLKDRARYAEAESLFQRAISIWEQSLGTDHPEMATALDGLANLYWRQGKYEEAESLFQRALAIREQQLGSEHPKVAYPLDGLANLYWRQGKYEEAESLFQRAISIWEQSRGTDHPEMATALDGLAGLYKNQGKFAEAEPLYQRALAIREQQLGSMHPSTASSLNNLANLYSEQGKYAEAESLYQRTLTIWEQSLGTEHPDVAISLNNLANLYSEQGKYAEAEPLFQRALAIREQRLRPEHPLVATSLNGLATLHHEQGKYAEAEPLFQRALAIWERSQRPEHPLGVYPLTGLANLYSEQGKYAEAEPLYLRALRIREQQLGPEHPDTAEVLHDLAALRERQGHRQEACALSQRALTIREQALGPEHPRTRATREWLIALRERVAQEAGVPPEDGISPEQCGQSS